MRQFAQKTNEGVEEDSPNDGLQERFPVNLWSLGERSFLNL